MTEARIVAQAEVSGVAGGARKGRSEAWTGFGVIFVCFFLSGATGLIYQVIWLRMLGLVFGHTVYAITAVLAAFMAGLALGSYVFARRTGHFRNLVRVYGWLEVAIAISCALIPFLLWLAAKVYVGLHAALGLSYDTFSLVQFLLVFLLLLVPTTLMGGTLPVLSQALVKQEVGLGRKVGALYSVNTFGAVTGVVLAGYWLLPALGNRRTIAVAVAANLAVGLLAILYGRRFDTDATARVEVGEDPADTVRALDERPDPPATAPERAASPLGARLTVIALGVSGAVSMVYEVCWTRAISLVIGSSTYAFTAMLVAFLVGIAAGSALYSWLWGGRRPSPAAFAVLQAGIGLAAAGTLSLFERMPELFLRALRFSDAPSFVQLVQFAVSASSLLPFTLLIGATFPCAVAVAARGAARVGRDVGEIYAINTLGAIIGSTATGFGLIPAVGVNASIKIGIAINLLLAAILFVPVPRLARGRSRGWRWGPAAAALATAGAVFLVPAWDQRVMSSGPAIYAKRYLRAAGRASLGEILRDQRLLFYRDGRSGTVSVSQAGEHVYLRVNGKVDASTSPGDMPTQLTSGHLPMLVHPDPKRVLVIGMGSGITAGAVLRHPVERVDIVEIEPAVMEASRFFASIHGDVLKAPRVRSIVADGRNFLLTTTERYDVIISEPSNPWIGGLASLFSAEFFQFARDHLRPGGIMVQWLQGYNLFLDDARMVVNTFRGAFPHVTVWSAVAGDFLLMGSSDPLAVDLPTLEERYRTRPGLASDLERLGLAGGASVLGYFLLGEQDAARFAAGAGVNNDDRLPLEFSAPRALYSDTGDSNSRHLRSFQTSGLPMLTARSDAALQQASTWYSIGTGHANRGASQDALRCFDRALELDRSHTGAMIASSATQLKLGSAAAALRLAEEAVRREPANARALYAAGLAAEAMNRPEEAVAFLDRAVGANPENAEFRAALTRAVRSTLR